MTAKEFLSLRPGDVVEVVFVTRTRLYVVKKHFGSFIRTTEGHTFANYKIRLVQKV